MTGFETSRTVEWGDCDAAGIIFYPNFYRFMDGHFHAFTASLGFDQRRLLSEFDILGMPLRQAGCTFHAATSFGDVLSINSRLVSLGETSLKLTYNFLRDGVPIADGFEVRVSVSADSGALAKAQIPLEIRALLDPHKVAG
ncbi:MAG: thioesterase family protein [Pseudomonadota bacterium]